MSAAKATSQPSLSMGTIRQAPVAFPSLEEQHQIVQEIESRLSVCDKVRKHYREFRKSQGIAPKHFEESL